MALISCDFYSEALEVKTSMTVILPQAPASVGAAPVLYLLHGLTDDHTTWQRLTSIERHVEPYGLAVVMPDVHRSFYADELHGHAYWTFLTQELPGVVSSLFRVSERPEDTFVAGLSMGGYGALKWALHEPSRFAAAASMSGALDVATFAQQPDRRALFERIFGGTPGSSDDLFELLRVADIDALPPIRISCGTEDDRVYESNQAFVKAAEQAGLELTVDFGPGEHEWGLWDTEIQKVLAWLPLSV